MSIDSTIPTSRRAYLSQLELEQFTNIVAVDETENDDIISQAEEIIDAYVGPQDKYMPNEITGLAAAGGSTSLTLETSQQNSYDVDYFKLCEIEIMGGTGEGQRRKITKSTKAGVLTVDAWTTSPSTDSFYRIYQLGKFPRVGDIKSYTNGSITTFYKGIPEAIKRAVAAQVMYILEMGDAFFAGDKSEMESERIGDYNYNKGENFSHLYKLVSPKAKILLKGIVNRTGSIEL